jgi:phosphatidate cytidylyltransferase
MSKNLKIRIITSSLLLLTLIIIFYSQTILLFSLIVLGIFSLIEFFNLTKKIIKNKIYSLITNLFFILYIFLFCLMFFYFSSFLYLKLILFSLLLGCIASDIGGYFFGKTIKGPKLTKISPKKTISGSIGSIIFTNIVILYLFFLLTDNLNLLFLILGTINSVSCQFGDFFFSFLKRKAKLKDTGNFFPGHGGVLDRLDGIFLGLPLSLIVLGFII